MAYVSRYEQVHERSAVWWWSGIKYGGPKETPLGYVNTPALSTVRYHSFFGQCLVHRSLQRFDCVKASFIKIGQVVTRRVENEPFAQAQCVPRIATLVLDYIALDGHVCLVLAGTATAVLVESMVAAEESWARSTSADTGYDFS